MGLRVPPSASTATTTGQIVRTRRRELGLSQAKLGDAAGLNRNQVTLLETGRRGASMAVLTKLCVPLQGFWAIDEQGIRFIPDNEETT